MLERQLSATLGELKKAKDNEAESIQKHFASLENRLNNFGATVVVNTKLERDREIQQVTRERDSLTRKVEQLVGDIAHLEKMLLEKGERDCLGCSRLATENSLLNRRLGVLQQSLKERELELTRQLERSAVAGPARPSSTPKISMKDLLQTAETIKGSNLKMSRMLEISEVEVVRTSARRSRLADI